MAASKRRYNFDVNQLLIFCDKFEETCPADCSVVFLDVKRQELERRWSKLIDSYDDYMMDETDREETKKETSMRYEEACNKYQTIKVIILEKMQPAANSAVDISPSVNTRPALKLPACEIHTFEGGYSKWPAFRDMFQAVIGKDNSLAPAQKLYYLRSKVRGEAYQTIKDFDLVDDNFCLAWGKLKNRFENKRLLVQDQIKKVHAIATAQTESVKSLRYIQNTINDCLSILRNYKIELHDYDPFLIHVVVLKLSEETIKEWEVSLKNHRELPTWTQLNEFLTERIEILKTMIDRKKLPQKENVSKVQSFHTQNEQNFTCKKCKQNHPLRTCKFFKAMPPNERTKFVFANKYCVNCLSPTHFKSKCTSTNSCSICHKKHHSMLHMEKAENSRSVSSSDNRLKSNMDNNEKTSTHVTHTENCTFNTQVEKVFRTESGIKTNIQAHLIHRNEITLLPTALIHIESSGELYAIRALLDAGTEKSFITTRTQQRLALPIEKERSQISGFGGTIVGSSKGKCLVTVKSRISNFRLKILAIVAPKIANLLSSKPVVMKDLNEIQNLTLADPHFYRPAPVDMIIGSDFLPFINLEGVRQNIAGNLEARESHFGWYLSGPNRTNEIKTFSTTVCNSDDLLLHEQMKKFWELEEVEDNHPETEAGVYCENFYRKTTFRRPDGRYVVRLPFKEEYPTEMYLGHSRNSALGQYYRMEKTLEKTPDLKISYEKVLQEYIDLSHMEPSDYSETGAEKQTSVFLPHHAVIRPESKSTKMRVVFNASKKTNSGFSLNDVLHQGTALQYDLMRIVLSWRYYRYVFTGDIEKMFRQILIHEDDRPYQQILFRPKANSGIKSFQLKTVTFGVNCAPFLAIRTLQQLSEDCKNSFPEASTILKNEIYVDDSLSGGHSVEEAKFKQTQLIKALGSAGFPMKKIAAKDGFLLQNLAPEDLLDEDFLKFDDFSTTKTLGIRWNAMSDYFFYVVQPNLIELNPTKRQILSVIARLYDPLGWIGSIVVIAKNLMQELWKQKTDWDDRVPPPISVKWNSFIRTLPEISSMKIPKWVQFSPDQQIEIHGFCDSSESAYCGAVYIRTLDHKGEFRCSLLVAKTKVAPIKKTTVPKLELSGAVLRTKLVKTLLRDEKYTYVLYMWTDSSIVLGWLQKPPQTLKKFVANRVTKILEVTNSCCWRHVKTEDNPADIGTRGCTPMELTESRLWWHDPT